VETD